MIPTKVAAKLNETSTEALVLALEALALVPEDVITAEERLVHAWTVEEIERRHPEVGPDVDAWLEPEEPEGTYAACLRASLERRGLI